MAFGLFNHRFHKLFILSWKLSCLTVVEIEQSKLENLFR